MDRWTISVTLFRREAGQKHSNFNGFQETVLPCCAGLQLKATRDGAFSLLGGNEERIHPWAIDVDMRAPLHQGRLSEPE